MGRFGGTIDDPRAWLFAVARREVSKAAEKYQHRRADGDPDTLLDTDTARWSSLTPQASAEDRYDLRWALEALTELSDRQKQTVYLSRVEGWKYREIAEALGIEENTVGPHINRANTRLRV